MSGSLQRACMAMALAGSLASGAAAQDAPKDPEVFTIGAILAMTGPSDWYGTVMSRAIRQAVEEINDDGGIGGVPLKAVIEDHQGGVAKEAVAGMNRLLNLHNTQVVLTSFSPSTLAIAPIADQKGIFLINGGGVSTALVGASKYLFHNRSLASDLGRAAVSHAREQGLTSMAQLAWKTDAGESIVKEVEPYWEQLGGEVVATEWMDVGAPNIDTQIAKIRAGNPDFVALWLFSPDPGLAVKRLREFGLEAPILGIEYNEDIQKIGGRFMNGYEFVSDYFRPSPDDPWSLEFAKGYRERYGEDPEFYAANYYEATYVIAELIRRAREEGADYWDGAKLAGELRKDPTFRSVYGGQMTFQENGVAQKRVALFKVEDGSQKFIRYIKPE
jgi:branched-chain amino acid transport system substrate-binding protein